MTGFLIGALLLCALALAFVLPPLWRDARRSAVAVALGLTVGAAGLYALLGTPDRASIPIERVLLAGVDILVVEDAERGPALAQELLRHPAIASLRKRATIAELPARLWTCAGPQLADAIETLAKARAEHERK